MCFRRLQLSLVLMLLVGVVPALTEGLSGQPSNSPSQRLRVLAGKSIVVNAAEPLARISVTNPEVATAISISERQVLIHGLRPGSVTLLLWNERDEVQSFDLNVELNVAGARESLQNLLPKEQVQVRQSGQALVLTGEVSSEATLKMAEDVAKTFSPEVVNLLGVKESHDVVLLKVRIAEVDRSSLSEFGVNLFSTGAGNTFGALSTQQFGGVAGAIGSTTSGGGGVQAPNKVGGGIGSPTSGAAGVIGLTDLMNIFIFRPDLNLGAAIRALQQQSLLQILAEPNILALDGREASFLAGGEFPFPIVQGGSNFTAVTIEFREFGVRLNFTPEVKEEGLIRLKVAPEVSALDFANALTVSGFVVPALTTRRAETEVDLKAGQSFAIAGLIDNRLIEVASKVPVLGDIPFLGKLFQSKSLDRSKSELLVIVTPQLVSGMDSSQVPDMAFPHEFMDSGEFDQVDDERPEESNAEGM